MKRALPPKRIAIAALAAISLFAGTLAFAQSASSPKAVNKAAALRSLSRATELLAAGDWEGASFEARLGATYDPAMADFPYVEALSLAARKGARADILERVETALTDGYFWRTYSRSEAFVLAARLKAETRRFSEALALLAKAGTVPSADADYVRVLALYGLERNGEARRAVDAALERWPFDARFARVFLTRERTSIKTGDAAPLAAKILSRLYVWENEDRELLLLAVPFEADVQSRVRDVRTYRGMGKNDLAAAASLRAAEADSRSGVESALPDEARDDPSARTRPGNPLGPESTVYALEYGILGEEAAEAELFAAQESGIPLSQLHGLCKLVGKKSVRASIESRLDGYEGVITDDADGDGIVDSRIRYRLGRPVEATFDTNQDGYPEFAVSCDLGEPATIAVGKAEAVVHYDRYPAVRAVSSGGREYVMKPLALSWAPVEWVREDFGFTGNAFYTIKTVGSAAPLTERLLAGSASCYTDGDSSRVDLENGIPVSAERRENGRIVSWTSYKRGFPSLEKADLDRDGYFETTSTFDERGNLVTVEADRNGNRRAEYREEYLATGALVKRWDSDENGAFEITWTRTGDGVEKTVWIHPGSGLPVTITAENGSPREVLYANARKTVIRDASADIWWIGALPQNSRVIAKKVVDAFNEGGDSVVTLSMSVAGKRLDAVRTGGMTFAELVDE